MSHDRVKMATRTRMAETGERYTVARRAVIAELRAASSDTAQDLYLADQRAMQQAREQLLAGQEATQLLLAEKRAMRQAQNARRALADAHAVSRFLVSYLAPSSS